jgi:hypothetical protein
MEYRSCVKIMGLGLVALTAVAGGAACDDTTAGTSSSSQAAGTSKGATSQGATSQGATSTPGTPGFSIDAGGFVTSGTLTGYAWTAMDTLNEGTTITPADFKTVAAGATELCASGSVGADSAYNGVAMLGVNVAQPVATGATSPAVGSVPPSGTGLTVNVKNNGTSSLRVQIQATGGDKDATKRWCAPLSGNTTTVPWTTFSTQCWSGATNPVPYDGVTPLESILILVPGAKTAATAFDFCLEGFSEG